MDNWKLRKRIFNNSTTGAQKPKWISPRSQVAICSGLVSIQVEFWCFLFLFISMDIKEKGEQLKELFCSIGFEMNNIHIPESTQKKSHWMPNFFLKQFNECKCCSCSIYIFFCLRIFNFRSVNRFIRVSPPQLKNKLNDFLFI